MKERIVKYLIEKNRGISTREIVEKFFHVFDRYPPRFEKIVESILKDDPRFVRDEIGEWSVRKKERQRNLVDIPFALVEIETVTISQRSEIPMLLGIAQIQNLKLTLIQLFSVEIPIDYAGRFKKQIEHRKMELSVENSFSASAEDLYRTLNQSLLVSYAPSKTMTVLNYLFQYQNGLELETETISLVDLARRLIPKIKIKSIEDIARALSMRFPSPIDLKSRLNLMHEIFSIFIDELIRMGIVTHDDLTSYLEKTQAWIDFSTYNFNKNYIENLPQKPGVYLMRDRNDEVVYVGKAKNLRTRVASYFINRSEMDEKGKSILSRLYNLTYEQMGSELEALLLENFYIKKFQPNLNTQINIYSPDISTYKTKQIILFLPGLTDHEIVLFLVKGAHAASKIQIDMDEEPDWERISQLIRRIFFEPSTGQNDFSREQIEIIWRWFALHHQFVNVVEIDRYGNLENCIEAVKKYCTDEKLYREKIYYL